MGGADAGTGEHRNGCFGNHWHVKRHQITFAETQRLQRIGGFAHLSVQLAIAESTDISRLSLPNQACFVGCRTGEMAIKTVKRKVGGPPLKPACEWGIAPVKDGVKGFEPMQLAASSITPKAIWIELGRLRQLPIGLQTADPRLSGQISRRVKHPSFLKHTLDRRVGVCHGSRLSHARWSG